MSRDDSLQLKQVAHAAKMGVWDVDIASGTVHCSPEVESLCWMPSGTFAGTYQATLQCVHPEDRARIDQVSTLLARHPTASAGGVAVDWKKLHHHVTGSASRPRRTIPRRHFKLSGATPSLRPGMRCKSA